MSSTYNRESDESLETPNTAYRMFLSDENGNKTKPNIPGETVGKEDDIFNDIVLMSASAPCTMRSKGRKYDVPTLLNIGHQLGSSVALVKSDLRESIDSGRGSSPRNRVLVERSINHSRTCTSLSISSETSCHAPPSAIVRIPRRQPRNAPHGNLAQRNEGFARFLKEHASPKHQRVTAGGRIVPMPCQLNDAPEFMLPEKNPEDKPNRQHPTTTKGDEAKPRVTSQRRRDSRAAIDNGGTESSKRRGSAGSQKSNLTKTACTTGPGQYQASAVTTPTALFPATQGNISNQGSTYFNTNLPVNLGNHAVDGVSMAMGQSDATNISFPNLQQSYPLAGIPHFVPQLGQTFAHTPYFTPIGNIGNYPAASNMAMMNPAQFYHLPANFAPPYLGPTAPGINQTQPIPSPVNNPGLNNALENAIQEFESISTQLSNLDRYMALHTWDFDPANKKILVSQRMELVMKLDTARVVKENLEATLRTPPNTDIIPGSFIPTAANVNAQNFMSGIACTPNQSSQNGYQQFARPAGAASLALNEWNSPVSPSQMSEIPYTLVEPVSSIDYQQFPTLTQGAQETRMGHDEWASCNPVYSVSPKVIGNFTDDESVKIMASATGEIFAQPASRWVPPPELSTIYQKIEEAAKRNEALGPLFQELAKVTARMNPLTLNNLGRSDSYFSQMQYPGSSDTINSYGPDMQGPSKPHGVKQTPKVRDYRKIEIRAAKQQRDNEPRQDKSDSMASTRGVSESSMTDCSTKYSQDLDSVQGSRASKGHGVTNSMNSSQTSYIESRCLPVAPVTTALPVLLGTPKDKALQRPTNIPRAMTPQTTQNALSFTPCRKDGHNAASRKVETLTVAQKINAQGYLPSFDGSGDSQDNKKSMTTNQKKTKGASSNNDTQANDSGKASSRSTLGWFTGFHMPDIMDVRRFYQTLREEDKNAVERYREEPRREF
ncbi:hypothetical protein FQN57_003214 [Myotisia sp. PD_48]|nr:hypothetical protein FQN57_003214 [Myotisia sp. PD_48]